LHGDDDDQLRTFGCQMNMHDSQRIARRPAVLHIERVTEEDI